MKFKPSDRLRCVRASNKASDGLWGEHNQLTLHRIYICIDNESEDNVHVICDKGYMAGFMEDRFIKIPKNIHVNTKIL